MMAMVFDVKNARCLGESAENFDRPCGGRLGICLGFHSLQYTQDFLAAQEFLALERAGLHEKLATMSIHKAIKTRREALGWSHQRLADEVSNREGRAKKLSWQAVQQWEKEDDDDGTAPSRNRLRHVADALGMSVSELLAAAQITTPSFTSIELKLLEGFRKLPQPMQEALLERVSVAAAEMDAKQAAFELSLAAPAKPSRKPKRAA